MIQRFLLIVALLSFQVMLFAKADLEVSSRAFAAEVGRKKDPAVELWFSQPWLEEKEKEKEFRPGHIALYPDKMGLAVVASFSDGAIHSEATAMNQPMWELGDVFEIFVAVPSQPKYWELHVTPNNHRLQLEWTEQAFDSFRQKDSVLSDHVISDVDFFTSTTRIDPDECHWQVYVFLPWASIGLPDGRDTYSIELAFCRYDSDQPNQTPVLSSTASFDRKNFHMREHWNTVILHVENSNTEAN